jgi:hypothetical protein
MKAFAATVFALAAALPAYADEPEFSPFAGARPTYGERATVIDGKKVTLVVVQAFLHDMGLGPGGVQEFDEEKRYFVKDGSGNLFRCEKWIKQVNADERAWKTKDGKYPYLEINVATNAKPITFAGKTVYRGADVRCWEAMDFGQPDF